MYFDLVRSTPAKSMMKVMLFLPDRFIQYFSKKTTNPAVFDMLRQSQCVYKVHGHFRLDALDYINNKVRPREGRI